MIISRVWAMPSKWTFTVKPISEILRKYEVGEGWIDPFAGFNSPAGITNDVELDRPTTYHEDALVFLKQHSGPVKGVLFDPPYSVDQCLRKYTSKFRGTAGRSEYWAECKKAIAKIIQPGGLVISFGWDSTGIGKKRDFEIIEILLVCHGACHNDTIVTVDKKRKGLEKDG